ncbi:MAG: glycosyltransferase [Pirellulales bacterium]|nr:glycosyltransferase [Pirellulales bacterium]
MKKVTVAINVYNGMPYLPEAVESVFAQTLQDFDLLVINDGSTDGSREYLGTLDDPRLRIIDQENQGCSAASNAAIQNCNTEYLARMDADDVAHPERLAAQLAFLEQYPAVGLLGGQTACLGKRAAGSSIKLPCTHETIWDALNRGYHAMAHPTLMMRTELIRQVGGYWSHRLADDDIDMMLRMGEASRLANLDRVVLHYRVHQSSISGVDIEAVRFSCDYAIELGKRRRSGLPAITPEDFRQMQQSRCWIRRAWESIEIHARQQYRLATEEIFGDHPLRGRARLVWAGLCSPQLSWQRLRRIFRRPAV